MLRKKRHIWWNPKTLSGNAAANVQAFTTAVPKWRQSCIPPLKIQLKTHLKLLSSLVDGESYSSWPQKCSGSVVWDVCRAVVYHNPRTLAPHPGQWGISNPRSHQPMLIIRLHNDHFWDNEWLKQLVKAVKSHVFIRSLCLKVLSSIKNWRKNLFIQSWCIKNRNKPSSSQVKPQRHVWMKIKRLRRRK